MRIFLLFIMLLFLASTTQAVEALTPLNEKLYYEASFAGVNIGKASIEIDSQPDKASVICDIVSSGILALFVKHSSHTTLTATGSDFTYPDRTYESHYQTKKKARSVKLVYKDGRIISQDIQPPENPEKRKAVPDVDKNSAYDLMSFLLQIRKEIAGARQNGKSSFTINGYDGRRLTQVDFTISGETDIKIFGKEQKVIKIISRRKLLAGFTKGEMEDHDPDEPSLTTYFSNDERLIPLRMELPFMAQTIRIDLKLGNRYQESGVRNRKPEIGRNDFIFTHSGF